MPGNTESYVETVKPKDKDELLDIINRVVEEKGNKCDLNFLDTSLITDFSDLFSEAKFNGNITCIPQPQQ